MSISSLVFEINRVRDRIEEKVSARVSEFERLNSLGNNHWFGELCFCILTANSSAELGIRLQDRIGDGFLTYTKERIEKELREAGHRFWRKRAEFIVNARRYRNIKDIISKIIEVRDVFHAREWLVRNIKGVGYKEASHFLRNVGYFDVAILDRHIISVMAEHGLCSAPKTLTRRRYLEIERLFSQVAELLETKPGILDLYVWYLKTGKVLK